MKKYLIHGVLLLLFFLPGRSDAARFDHGRWLDASGPAHGVRRARPRITMGDAMERVQRRAGGRVLVAREARVEGRRVYRIKILTRRGEVRVFFVDAETGEMQ